jgi:excisionase family DNA binding protein
MPSTRRLDMESYPDILTLAQAASYLQVSERTILRMLKAGEMPGRQVGSQWRFDREQLRAWIRGHDPLPARPLTQRELIEQERARLGVDLPEMLIDLQQSARRREAARAGDDRDD